MDLPTGHLSSLSPLILLMGERAKKNGLRVDNSGWRERGYERNGFVGTYQPLEESKSPETCYGGFKDYVLTDQEFKQEDVRTDGSTRGFREVNSLDPDPPPL